MARCFTQADIAEPDFDDPQDLNRYAYVGNNPINATDPTGNIAVRNVCPYKQTPDCFGVGVLGEEGRDNAPSNGIRENGQERETAPSSVKPGVEQAKGNDSSQKTTILYPD